MTDWWILLFGASALLNVYLLLRKPKCRHHWHPADAMIAWRCCWCDAERDGMPLNDVTFCAEETVHLQRERDQLKLRVAELLEQNEAAMQAMARQALAIRRYQQEAR